jgi:hypothetical protein
MKIFILLAAAVLMATAKKLSAHKSGWVKSPKVWNKHPQNDSTPDSYRKLNYRQKKTLYTMMAQAALRIQTK